MWAVVLLGAAVVIFCAYRLPISRLDLRFLALVVVSVFIASRITIKIPMARGNISVSDTFIFLAMLMFGGEAAVLLAASEAFASSVRLNRRANIRVFNAGVMAVSTFTTATVLHFVFGSSGMLNGAGPVRFELQFDCPNRSSENKRVVMGQLAR